mmetsp:Transcript_37701/g.81063  ORF Transcript_37701/g.81063 Transcript_37701/m.81063 type:complete len:161 (-) Transcript_37701:32-514(-)
MLRTALRRAAFVGASSLAMAEDGRCSGVFDLSMERQGFTTLWCRKYREQPDARSQMAKTFWRLVPEAHTWLSLVIEEASHVVKGLRDQPGSHIRKAATDKDILNINADLGRKFLRFRTKDSPTRRHLRKQRNKPVKPSKSRVRHCPEPPVTGYLANHART